MIQCRGGGGAIHAKGRCRNPNLLRGIKIERVNQVWSTAITYIPMAHGFVYLVAVMDWCSRFVLSGGVVADHGTGGLRGGVAACAPRGHREIFNSDQGSQFTSDQRVEVRQIAVSRDGRGRCLDNIFIERLVAVAEV